MTTKAPHDVETKPAPFVSTMDDREYQHYIDQFIGIPWALNGEDPKTGLDCRTLAIRFLKGQGVGVRETDGAPLPEKMDDLDMDRYERGVKAAGTAVQTSELRRNDVVYFRNVHHRLHIGVWLGYNKMLTTDARSGSIVVKINPKWLLGAIRGRQGAWLDMPPGHDPVTAFFIAVGSAITAGAATGTTALIIGVVSVAATAASIGFGIAGLVTGRPSFDLGNQGLGSSPRYSIDGARNIRSNQYPVPLIYGAGPIRILQTYEVWNSGQAVEEQKRIVVIGEGELGSVSDVELNGEPIASFPGSSATTQVGTATQAVDSRAAGSDLKSVRHRANIALTLKAAENLNGDPVITCDATGRKIARWNGTDWTTLAAGTDGNPAAIIRDYLTLSRERGGCGFPVAQIDDASFGEVYDHCEVLVDDGEGGTEPRARLDYILDTFRAWIDNVQDMAATFGGFLVTDGRKFVLRVEKDESSVQSFTADNMKQMSYQTTTKEDRPNRIIGVYVDPSAAGNDARTRISVDDLTDQEKNPRGIVPQEVPLLGIQRQSQCIREITKILNDARVNWYTIVFTTNMNAIAVEPGDVITVTHPILGDGVTAFKFRVMRMQEMPDHEIQITAKAFNTTVFNDGMEQQVAALDYTPPVDPFTPPPEVTGISLAEQVTLLNDGTVFITVDASWTAPLPSMAVKEYQIEIKKGAGAYEVYGLTKTEAATLVWDFEVGQTYTVRVKSISIGGVRSTGAESAGLAITGLPPAPGNVGNFAATFTNEIVFTWDKNTETDLAGYEIRTEDAKFGVQSAALVWRGNANEFTIVTPGSRSPGTYYIRAYNNSGQFSAASVSVTPTNAAPAAPTVSLTQWFGFAKLDWTDSADTDLLYYEVLKSHTGAWAGEEFLESRTPGTQAIVQGNAPVEAEADAADATSITDAVLIGSGTDYFVGDRIKQVSGTHTGQEATVTAYDDSTGKVTVASWPTGTPSVGDDFVLKDRAHFKVRGVDTFGNGTLSASKQADFTPLAAAEIGDGEITARKLTTGELISLSAQIKDAIINNAHIVDLHGSKITANTITATQIAAATITATEIAATTITGAKIAASTITADKLSVTTLSAIVVNTGALTVSGTLTISGSGDIRSGDYVASTAGFLLHPTTGLEINEGTIKGGTLVVASVITDKLQVNSVTDVREDTNSSFQTGTTENSWEDVTGFSITFTPAVVVDLNINVVVNGYTKTFTARAVTVHLTIADVAVSAASHTWKVQVQHEGQSSSSERPTLRVRVLRDGSQVGAIASAQEATETGMSGVFWEIPASDSQMFINEFKR